MRWVPPRLPRYRVCYTIKGICPEYRCLRGSPMSRREQSSRSGVGLLSDPQSPGATDPQGQSIFGRGQRHRPESSRSFRVSLRGAGCLRRAQSTVRSQTHGSDPSCARSTKPSPLPLLKKKGGEGFFDDLQSGIVLNQFRLQAPA